LDTKKDKKYSKNTQQNGQLKMERHRKAVSIISSAVNKFYKNKQPFRISHGSTNSTRNPHQGVAVDTSKLSNVM